MKPLISLSYRCSVIIFFVLLFTISSLISQVKIHKNFNIEDGMVYSQVLSIIEDRNGYMWFGTSSGLSRWDGLNFKNFIFPEGLSDNNCKWLAEFSDSTLFFATRRGVVSYRNETFSTLPNAPVELNNWIHSMMASTKDQLFIATDTSGLWIYDGNEFSNLNRSDGLGNNCARALAQSKNGSMYVADGTGKIFTFRNGHLYPIQMPKLPNSIEITALFEDSEGAMWIGTRDKGLYIQFDKNIINFASEQGMPSNTVTFLSRGDSSQVFVSTDDGLVMFENYRLQTILDDKSGLSNNFIWQVFRAQNGLYYIGTDGGGVDIYRPGLFQTINMDCGLPHNTVWTICETKEHNFYFGTDEGLARFDNNSVKIYNTASGLSSNMILTLHEGNDGTLYVGSNETGVDIIKNGRIRNINKQHGLPDNSIWTITECLEGNVYFGTYEGGISIWDGNKIIDTLDTADGLPANSVISSYRCTHGSLYFGTDGYGAFRIHDGEMDSLLLPGNTIWSIFEDENEDLFFGTNDNGLIYSRNGQWDTLDVNDGLSHNSILGILKDQYGKFYLSADNGLNIVEFIDGKPNIRILGNRDGLASSECNQGAYYRDSQGFLWFGTVNGVSRYNPTLDLPNKNPPKIHLNRFQVFDRDLPVSNLSNPRVFNYNENYLKFEFIGVELLAPHKVSYKYKLSGVDADWVTTKHPFIQYTSLDDDHYTFQVMAGNEWGYWSEPLVLSFEIKPAFWETWWFIILSFMIVISPAIVVIRQRIKRLLAVERLRNKIAADLHDDIGAGLSEINILSAVVAAKTPPDAKAVCENELNKIGQTARNLIESMSDIVWLVNPQKDALSDLISRLSDSFADVFVAKGIEFKTENAEALQNIRMSMEYRQNLFMIIKEAIHNSVKYSEAKLIQLIIENDGNYIRVYVKDDGGGFDINSQSNGNGLKNMQTRAGKIKAQVAVSSEMGKGTTIKFSGPVK